MQVAGIAPVVVVLALADAQEVGVVVVQVAAAAEVVVEEVAEEEVVVDCY